MTFNLSQLAGDFQFRVSTFTPSNTSATKILSGDNRRIAIFFGNGTGGAVNVGIDGNVNQLFGFPVSNSTNPWVAHYRDLGPAVSGDWFAQSETITIGHLMVLEILYTPTVSEPSFIREESDAELQR